MTWAAGWSKLRSRIEFKPRVTIAFPLQLMEWYCARFLIASSLITVPTETEQPLTKILPCSSWEMAAVAVVFVSPVCLTELSFKIATRSLASFSKETWPNCRTVWRVFFYDRGNEKEEEKEKINEGERTLLWDGSSSMPAMQIPHSVCFCFAQSLLMSPCRF